MPAQTRKPSNKTTVSIVRPCAKNDFIPVTRISAGKTAVYLLLDNAIYLADG